MPLGRSILFSFLLVSLSGCVLVPAGMRLGDRPVQEIEFSGSTWVTKSSDEPVGPGPTRFSNSSKMVCKDWRGRLHLTLQKSKDGWQGVEVKSKQVTGYGLYTFWLASDVSQLDPNVVAGLFTWDSSTFQAQANSELDLEFTRWGNARDSAFLQYAVHPGNELVYPERSRRLAAKGLEGVKRTAHTILWTDTLVSFASYRGCPCPGHLVAEWHFRNHHPRRKYEDGEFSQPVGIPAPGRHTQVRLNLWLFDTDKDGRGDAPQNQKPARLIVEKFSYKPL